ncbi:MAG: hypothetical protein L3K26_12245 [Candidatus Hydrogenedentes bacterium]|nr:hypothetical protein [Candidatus Hydrogenedentota bacterium]
MSSCRNIHGLIASSLYEPLNEADQIVLQGHLADCPSCAAEHASLQTLVELVPNEPIAFTGDLRPALHEALRHDKASKHRSIWAVCMAVTAFCIVVFVGLVVFRDQAEPDDTVIKIALNPLDQTLADARALATAGDPMAARTLLEEGIAQYAGSSDAAVLRLEIADLEFADFGRYKEAYDVYEVVREQNSEVWSQSSGAVKERYDLLTEAREDDYEPLNQIDRARSLGERGIPALESIMAKYPGRTLAAEALTTMVACVEGDGVGALENLRSRFTNPIAVAQLDVRLGEAYWQDDPERGRKLLETVADAPHEVPARMARETLARLMPGSR